jgi:Spy/CpxP family protein refolding chaperone
LDRKDNSGKTRGRSSARLATAATVAMILAMAAAAAGQAPPPAKGPYVPGAMGTSLAPDEVAELQSGMGMGLARAAELNQYPGPRHLVDLADKLGLSVEQRRALQRLGDETIDHAREVGRRIIAKEAELNGAFARQEITEPRLRALVAELADLWGQLRVIHLSAHLKTVKLLTATQIEQYHQLRGYAKH